MSDASPALRCVPATPTNWGLLPELSISLAGLEPTPGAPWAAGPRAAIEWAASAGFRAVQLDATAPGIRPRELDRSARRDLAALLRRLRLGVSGLDLWIPTEHFLDAARAERATEAALNAIAMAGELARLAESASGAVVSLALSPEVPAPLHSVLERQADQHGVDLADHAIRDTHPEPDVRIGTGIDPASLLLAGKDPAAAAAKAGRALKCVRLSDANGIGRTAVGAPGSRLDVLSLQAAISVAGYKREVVADLRGVRDQLLAASRARSAWTPSA